MAYAPDSPAQIGIAFSQGLKDADSITESQQRQEEFQRARREYEENNRPMSMDMLKKIIPADMQEATYGLASAMGYVENIHGTEIIRRGKFTEFAQNIEKAPMLKAGILDQSLATINKGVEASKTAYTQLSTTVKNQIGQWKSEIDDELAKLTKDRPDGSGRKMVPDYEKISKIEAKIKGYEQSEPYMKMKSLEKIVAEGERLKMKRMQAFTMIDDAMKANLQKYGQDGLLLNAGLITREELEDREVQRKEQARQSEVRETKGYEAAIKERPVELKPIGTATSDGPYKGRAIFADKEGRTWVNEPKSENGMARYYGEIEFKEETVAGTPRHSTTTRTGGTDPSDAAYLRAVQLHRRKLNDDFKGRANSRALELGQQVYDTLIDRQGQNVEPSKAYSEASIIIKKYRKAENMLGTHYNNIRLKGWATGKDDAAIQEYWNAQWPKIKAWAHQNSIPIQMLDRIHKLAGY